MEWSWVDALVGVAVSVVLAAVAVRAGALTRRAGAVAAAFGSLIVIVGGFPFLALLVLFVLASVLSTRYRFEEKRRRNVQEGTQGERGVSNVLSHVLVPTGLVLGGAVDPAILPAAPLAVLYTAALAFGASDTFASEFGVLAGPARSILTGRPVTPGTNGGVSDFGELFAGIGAVLTGAFALGLWLLFAAPYGSAAVLVGVGSASGFLGCQIDSFVGATLENRGLLTKGSTNLVSMAASVAIAAVLLVAVGAWT